MRRALLLLALSAAATGGRAQNARVIRGDSAREAMGIFPTVAITRVVIIDGSSATPRQDQTVVVRGDRILAVGPAATTPVPAGARVLDGRGKFLIPGLWDMHVHTAVPGGRGLLAAYVVNGVTGVRDMAGAWDTLTTWRREIATGVLIGPRIVASGPYIEGGVTPIPHIVAKTPDEARRAVDSLKKLGVDFVKVHGQLNRETYLAAVAAAKGEGLSVAGHVPRVVGAADASDAGVKSIEHLLSIPHPCTPAESIAMAPRFTIQGALGRCSSANLEPLFAKLARNGTWVTPTFVAQYEVSIWPKHDVPGDAYAQYIPDTLRKFVAQIFPVPDSVPPDADVNGRAVFARRVALAAALHRAGVGILVGTDAPLRNSPPGFGLHEEMRLLVSGGISPYDVLKAATYEPARFLGALDRAGTVTAGKMADLVLLDADPLAGIGNTRRISAVIAAGRLYDGAAREGILNELLRAGR